MTADTPTVTISRKPWKRTVYLHWNPIDNKWEEIPAIESTPEPPPPDPGHDVELLRDQVFALRQKIEALKDSLQAERESARFDDRRW